MCERPQGRGGRLWSPDPCTEQALGQCVGGGTRCLTAHDEVGQTPQILHKHDANCNCKSPELADRQWLNALIGQHEASKHFRFKTAVGMRDKGPGYFEDARISLERAFRKFWKLTVITRRKIGSDLTDLIFRDMKIVDQPFGCGGYGALIRNSGCDDTIGWKKGFIIFPHPL